MDRHDSLSKMCSHPHAHYGQRLQELGLPQCKYYGSVKQNDPAAMNVK